MRVLRVGGVAVHWRTSCLIFPANYGHRMLSHSQDLVLVKQLRAYVVTLYTRTKRCDAETATARVGRIVEFLYASIATRRARNVDYAPHPHSIATPHAVSS